jgi:phosphoribosylformimino-5-aminoimidazole carboxamide ribotide isomerase
MTKFRPCIDLHEGKVKQIVGGTLRDRGPGPEENFVATQGADVFAGRFRDDGLRGGHVIKLGPGNDEAARIALAAWPGGLQVGGGINGGNAREWIAAGASHLIVTSALFDEAGRFLPEQLAAIVGSVGAERLVVDLSCRRTADGWQVAMDRWQHLTELEVNAGLLDRLAPSCAEFLVHAADVEGKCGGVDRDLVKLLGQWEGRAVTYAGGVRDLCDVRTVEELSGGRLDVTVGSALDLFGGHGVRYDDLLEWNSGALR